MLRIFYTWLLIPRNTSESFQSTMSPPAFFQSTCSSQCLPRSVPLVLQPQSPTPISRRVGLFTLRALVLRSLVVFSHHLRMLHLRYHHSSHLFRHRLRMMTIQTWVLVHHLRQVHLFLFAGIYHDILRTQVPVAETSASAALPASMFAFTALL